MTYSIRARLTLWFTAVMVVALTLFSAGIVWLHARWGRAQFDSELRSLAAALSRVMQEEVSESGNLRKALEETRISMDVPDRATAVLDLRGQPLSAAWHGFRYADAGLSGGGFSHPSATTVIEDGQPWRVLTQRETSAVGDYVILVAGPLEQVRRQQSLLTRVLAVAAPLIVLVTAGSFWWVASSALRPMTTMAAQAEAITVHSSAWRLDVPAAADELGQLARAFNRLLDRLLAASQMQRQFMADASHELRTPVSVIHTSTEVTLQQPTRAEAEYREALTIVGEQSTRLTRMVEDMMVLARADAGGQRPVMRLVYLDDIVAECVRAIAVVAATRDIQLTATLEPDVTINGDDGMLRRLVTNLLDNAVRYTTPAGRISVALSREGGFAHVMVSDTGPGIPLPDRARVFDRFVRLDPARSATSGAGLGLPIARWIAEQHGGGVTVEENADGGCLFIAHLAMARRVSINAT